MKTGNASCCTCGTSSACSAGSRLSACGMMNACGTCSFLASKNRNGPSVQKFLTRQNLKEIDSWGFAVRNDGRHLRNVGLN